VGLDKLDKCGVIQEIADHTGRLAAIARKQIEALTAQTSSLIIAPTHGECRAIAGAVREAMKEKGLLSEAEHSVTRLERLNLTDSQQRDAVPDKSRGVLGPETLSHSNPSLIPRSLHLMRPPVCRHLSAGSPSLRILTCRRGNSCS
jgi:hypothetical protein